MTPTGPATRNGAGGRALLALALGVAALAPVAGGLWQALGRDATPFPTDRLLELGGAHALLAGVGGLAGIVAGIAIGLAVTRPSGRALRPIAETLTALAQAVPPVVVVALALPALGFGWPPAALALLLYAVMPVSRATIAALEAVPTDARDAATAMGMTPLDVLRRIEAPLAWPLVLPAARVAMVLATSTAAVGALAGAATLGTPIVLGLQNQNELMLLQGAAATAALAFAADAALLAVARLGTHA